MQRIKNLTELAGVDVILVHRLLKNDVPIPEYMLMTEPVHQRVDSRMRERAACHPLELPDLGPTETLLRGSRTLRRRSAGESPRCRSPARLARNFALAARSLPETLGLREACAGFRNIGRASRRPRRTEASRGMSDETREQDRHRHRRRIGLRRRHRQALSREEGATVVVNDIDVAERRARRARDRGGGRQREVLRRRRVQGRRRGAPRRASRSPLSAISTSSSTTPAPRTAISRCST